jgi:hypothetical protein
VLTDAALDQQIGTEVQVAALRSAGRWPEAEI